MAQLSKIYQSCVNVNLSGSNWNGASSASGTLTQCYAWNLKTLLLGQSGTFSPLTPSASLWTVYQSSDGVNSGSPGDGVDRWVPTGSNTAAGGWQLSSTASMPMAYPGQAHAWMVLKSTGSMCSGSGPYYLTIDLNLGNLQGSAGVQGQYLGFVMSRIAPGSGTLLTRPTASDEWFAQSASNQIHDGTQVPWSMHFSIANDGCFFALTSKNGSAHFWNATFAQEIAETRAADKYPCVLCSEYVSTTSSPLREATNFSATGGTVPSTPFTTTISMATRNIDGSRNLSAFALLYNGGSALLMSTVLVNGADSADNLWDDVPIYIVANTTGPNHYTIKGRLVDVKWAQGAPATSNGLAQGTVEPASGQQTTLVCGQTWLPFSAAPIL